jgi:hypothetical protein
MRCGKVYFFVACSRHAIINYLIIKNNGMWKLLTREVQA